MDEKNHIYHHIYLLSCLLWLALEVCEVKLLQLLLCRPASRKEPIKSLLFFPDAIQ